MWCVCVYMYNMTGKLLLWDKYAFKGFYSKGCFAKCGVYFRKYWEVMTDSEFDLADLFCLYLDALVLCEQKKLLTSLKLLSS